MTPTSGQGASTPFRLHDLAPELQNTILVFIDQLPQADLSSACRVSKDWNTRLTSSLYHSLAISKANREAVFYGLGLDYLNASAVESRAFEDGGGAASYAPPSTPGKAESLSQVRCLALADSPAAVSVAEAITMHKDLFTSIEELDIGPSLFRYLVTSIAAFGRPRTGSAFIGEMLVTELKPRRVRITFPPPKSGAPVFDPVILARVMAVLVIEWQPETIDYYNVRSDFPPLLGSLSRIHCMPCIPGGDDDWGDGADDPMAGIAACRAHGSLVRMHLRRNFAQYAREDLLEVIAEAADPTDEDDLDPDEVPDPAEAHVEYHGVPCITSADHELFLNKTFAHWPADVDVASQVSFFA